jgi:ABC-2 type transport system permease protein
MPLMSSYFSVGDTTYVQFIFPGVIGMNVVMTSVMMGTSVVWDREFGFLRGALTTPAGRSALLLGKVAGGTTIATVQGLLLLALAPWAGIQLGLSLVLALFGLTLLISVALTTTGLVVALCIRSVEGFHAVMQFAAMGMVFLGGAFFPLQEAPRWMNLLMLVNPATYAIDLLRQTTFQHQVGRMVASPPLLLRGHQITTTEEALILAALGSVTLMASALLFNRQE